MTTTSPLVPLEKGRDESGPTWAYPSWLKMRRLTATLWGARLEVAGCLHRSTAIPKGSRLNSTKCHFHP